MSYLFVDEYNGAVEVQDHLESECPRPCSGHYTQSHILLITHTWTGSEV